MFFERSCDDECPRVFDEFMVGVDLFVKSIEGSTGKYPLRWRGDSKIGGLVMILDVDELNLRCKLSSDIWTRVCIGDLGNFEKFTAEEYDIPNTPKSNGFT